MRKAIRELKIKAKLKLHEVAKESATNYKNSVGK